MVCLSCFSCCLLSGTLGWHSTCTILTQIVLKSWSPISSVSSQWVKMKLKFGLTFWSYWALNIHRKNIFIATDCNREVTFMAGINSWQSWRNLWGKTSYSTIAEGHTENPLLLLVTIHSVTQKHSHVATSLLSSKCCFQFHLLHHLFRKSLGGFLRLMEKWSWAGGYEILWRPNIQVVPTFWWLHRLGLIASLGSYKRLLLAATCGLSCCFYNDFWKMSKHAELVKSPSFPHFLCQCSF